MGLNVRKILRNRPRPESSSSAASPTASTISTATSALQHQLPPMPVQPGDLPPPLPPGHKVSPLEIRGLSELIRKRYGLDVEIWNKRTCRPRDRYLILDKMRRSDAALMKIMAIVRMWDTPEVWDSNADYHRLKAIRQRLEMEGGKKLWEGNPPWEA